MNKRYGYYLLLLMLTFVTGCSASRATAVYKYREIRRVKYGDK